MRLAICIAALSGGGAERVAAVLAEGLAEQGDEVLVVTNASADSDFYPLPAAVARRCIGPFPRGGPLRDLASTLFRVTRLRRALREFRPDVVVAFMGITNVRALWAARGSGVPVIVTEHTDPRFGRPPLPWGLLRRWAYRHAAKLVSVSAGVDAGFPWLDPQKRAVIPNPLPPEIGSEASGPTLDFPAAGRSTVVSMGRLERFKGHDLLITAFSRLAADLPDWDLLVLGEGGERSALERLVRDLGLEGRVRLVGAVQHPFPVLRRCQVFALASRHEGFGNALIEAMACGLPVVATDCPSGPGEIVHDGDDGLLVPVGDARALESALRLLMTDSSARERLAAHGRRTSEAYRLPLVLERWRALLREVRGDERGDLAPGG